MHLDESKALISQIAKSKLSNFRYVHSYNYKSHSAGKSVVNSSGDNRYYTFCGKYRHTIETYSKKHGYPPGYKPRGSNVTVNNVTAVDNIQAISSIGPQTNIEKSRFSLTQE